MTAQQMVSYRWAQDSRGNRREYPHKENDHAADCVRYGVHSEKTRVFTVTKGGYGSGPGRGNR